MVKLSRTARPRSRSSLTLAALSACAVLAVVATSGHGEEPAGLALRRHGPVAAAQQAGNADQALAERYSPIVRMEPPASTCDANTSFGPTSVDILFEMPDVALRSAETGEVIQSPRLAALADLDETYYLDLPGDPRTPGCALGDLVRTAGPPRVTYARVITEEGEEGLVVQYWLYYVLNDWNNDHESDWEFIQIRFEASTAEEALTKPPVETAYSQHGGGERAAWDGEKLQRDGDHPIVYVSQGSNANYYAPRVYLGKGEPGTGFGCDDTSGHRLEFAPEVRLIPEAFEGDREWGWLAFQGRWGELLPGENKGPTGPITKPYFDKPLTWQDGQRDVSLSFGGGSGGGVTFFCDLAAFGGSILNSFQLHPVVVGGLVFAGAALASVSSAVTFRVSRRPLGFEARDPMNWERPSRLGQLVRGAFSIYGQFPFTFAGIAAVALLLGSALLAAVQLWLFSAGPLGRLLEVVDSRGFSAFLALVYGYSANVPLILLATATAIAGMSLRHEGAPVTVLGAYRRVWANLPDLLFARLKAIAIIAVLMLTIVGVPSAIRRLVRWYFLEQAILFDGQDRIDAPQTSELAVDDHWWHGAGRIALISLYGTLPAPILSFVLIMLTDLPLASIHVIGAAVYTLLIPWTGIALGLLYFDLRSRADEVPPTTGDGGSFPRSDSAYGGDRGHR